VLQGLVSLLRDLVLAGTAPDRLELTSVSPQFRAELPDLARSIGKARLLQWQAQLKGSEQQLRHSVNPRLWLEVLLLGLLAEPVATATAATTTAAPISAPVPAPAAAPLPVKPAMAAPTATIETAASPEVIPAAPAPAAENATNLPELWQQILAGLELPSTRMLLSQQAQLVRLDERRAVVQVAGNWMAMVQSRLSLLEAAVAKALGSPRQLVLEGGGEHTPPTSAAPAPVVTRVIPPPAPTPTPAPVPAATPAAVSPMAQPAAALEAPTAAPRQDPAPAAPLDEKARRLAEFFNGEVIELDGPIDGIPSKEAAA
jgi:DNA polymerase-3 subunit gamma/tau